MKRVFTTAALLMALLAATGASFAVQPSLAGPGAAPAASFAPPINASQTGNIHPAVIGASTDGTVNLPYPDQANQAIDNSVNHTFYGPFDNQELDNSSNLVGSLRMVSDSHGRLHTAWYHNYGDGSTQIIYARKDPGTNGSQWQINPIPGSDTGGSTNGSYKVVGIARGPVLGNNDRIYVMWARNGVGARISWTDDGVNWAPYEDVPGPFDSLATDINMGATTGGNVFIGWFDRAPFDIFVQMRSPSGQWGPVTDVSNRPNHGQDYTPRFGTAPDGSLRLVWSGFAYQGAGGTDGFYREWTPAGGWNPNIVQIWNTPGSGNSRGVEVVVDNAGVSHIVWDDDTGRDSKNVTTYYIRGQGTDFTPPQQVVGRFGQATARYPYADVRQIPDGTTKVHISTNSNVSGAFDNYYTWTDDPITGTPVPVLTATPTATAVPPSPTACTAGVYSDVPPNFPFYAYIHDLTVRNAISGYGDCTFRPFNNITRGQVAKVIMVADAYQLISPPNADFEDVPIGSAFYDYVETAFRNGIISGYTCGGPGEPCDPQNRPYFRPFANVTRGQLSKMVVLGRQWTQLNPATADFEDVLPNTTFYTVIETAYAHGIISGYNCGGPGEPCDPQNRPYFRQYNPATRAQAAKIIDLALYSANITPTATPQPSATATSTAVPPTVTVTVVAGTPTSTVIPSTSTVVPATSTAVVGTATPTAPVPTVTLTLPALLNTPTVTPTRAATVTVTPTP